VCCGSASARGRVRRPRICAAADADAAAAGKYISAVLCATATAGNWLQWLQYSQPAPLSQVVVVVSPSCREMATTDGVVSAATVGKLSTIERVVKSECVCPSVRLSVTFAAAPAVELFRSSPAPSCAAPTERIATSLTDGVCLSLGL